MSIGNSVFRGAIKLGGYAVSTIKDAISASSSTALVTENAVVNWLSANNANVDELITQADHQFTNGTVVTFASGQWTRAQANTAATAEAIGIATQTTSDTFRLVTKGLVTGLLNLTPESVYFLSASDPGVLTDVRPSGNDAYIVKPMLFAVTANAGYVLNYLGVAAIQTIFSKELHLLPDPYVDCDEFSISRGSACDWIYSVRSSDNSKIRGGRVLGVWNPSDNTTEYQDISTNDLTGGTEDISFSVFVNASNNVVLRASNSGSIPLWNIRVRRELS